MTGNQQMAAKARALEALEAGASVDQAAEAAGVHRGTLWRWRQADADFDGGWQESVGAGTLAIEDNVVRYASGDLSRPGAVTAAIFMLKSRLPEVYSERKRIETVISPAAPDAAMDVAIAGWLEANPDKRDAVRDLMSVVGEHNL